MQRPCARIHPAAGAHRRGLLGRLALAAATLATAAGTAPAQELSTSVYGTLGYAVSNRDFRYQRWIDDGGTWMADSVLGLQADLRLSPQWSATLQLKAAPSLKSDSRIDLRPAWAFVAWRPGDDWLLRLGKMRLPVYLYSEAMDVGNTHDMARLPAEVYGLLPSSDFQGLSVTRNWLLGAQDVSLDVYAGGVRTTGRFWLRDGLPPQLPAGALFRDVDVQSRGLVLTLRGPETTLRTSLHSTRLGLASGEPIASSYPWVQLAPGLGYWQITNQLPGPGVPASRTVRNLIFTLGADWQLRPTWRVAGELTRLVQRDTQLGLSLTGAYVAAFHRIGRFTPYASLGMMRSDEVTRRWHARLTGNLLPPMVPGADQINALQRLAGESGYQVDQTSLALGSSYAIDANQKIKLEWLRTRIGQVSRFVDTPPGQPSPQHTSVQVWSLNYSFSF